MNPSPGTIISMASPGIIISMTLASATLACASSPARQLAQTPPSTAALDTISLRRTLDSMRVAMDIPGASVALVLADGQTWTAASGVATGMGTAVSTDMLFEIGSITKTFVAALVLDLAATGALSLDGPLSRWVPDFSHAEGVTLRHLLQHTSGLHNYSENPEYIPALRSDFTRVWRPEDSYRFMKEPYFPPGEGWRYSSANYLLLGQVVERATGEPFARVLRRRLLEPQALPQTFFAATEDVRGDRAHAFLDINGDGKPEDFTSLVPNTSFITAAGSAGAIVSTASDLARFAHALYRGEVVRERWFAEMTRSVERGDGMRYGLGVIQYAPDGEELRGHKGNTVGYSAAVWHAVRPGVTVAVLTNKHAEDVTPLARAFLRGL